MLLILGCAATLAAAQSASDTLAGRRLSEALQMLQASGLHIVFTSELVTPDMRVRREPKAKTPRDQLDELLDPHGLGTKDGADDTIVVVRKPKPRPGPFRAGREAGFSYDLSSPGRTLGANWTRFSGPKCLS